MRFSAGRQLVIGVAASLLCFCLDSGRVFAADQPDAAGDDGALQEITVTALRRSESIQKVPASITALSGTSLEDMHLEKVENLVTVVPNLQQTAGVGEGDVNFSLRGVSLLFEAPNQQSPIALYSDGVYIGGLALQGVTMYDLERVEVLAGPQGTLYGKNASGGAINLISRQPTQSTEGYLSVGGGNYGRFEASGAFQAPITDTLAARVAFTYARANGWFQNVYPGQADASSTRYYGVRGTVAWTPSDALKVTLKVETSLSDPTQYGIYAVGRNPTDVPGTCFGGFGAGVGCGFYAPSYFRNGLGTYQFSSNFQPDYDHSAHSAAVTVDWKATDHLALTSISSYNKGHVGAPQDYDGSPLQVFEVTATNADMKQLAQELRLTSSFSGGLNFIAGAYFNRETSSHIDVQYQYYADGGTTCDLVAFYGCTADSRFSQIKETEAAFADLSYQLAALTLHGGLRFTHDQGQADDYVGGYYNISPFTPVLVGIDGISPSYTTNKVTGRAGIDYQLTPDHMLYLSYSTSFRGSTFNVAAVDTPEEAQPAAPEEVRSIEGGIKTQWLNRTVTLNAAAFVYNYTNQQAFQNFNSLLTLYSVPKSRLIGGEVSGAARPTSRLHINAAFGYVDARVREGVLQGISIVGARLPDAARFTGNLAVDWDLWQGGIGTLSAGANANYTSKFYFDLFNTERLAQNGYPLFGGNVRFKSADEHLTLTLWGRNLANRMYFTSGFDNTGLTGSDSFTLGAPRMYGGTLQYNF